VRRGVAVAAVTLALAVGSRPLAAQTTRPPCKCPSAPGGGPGGVPIVVGTPPEGGGEGGGDDGWLTVVPFLPIGAIFGGRGGPTGVVPVLVGGDSTVRIEPFQAAETRASIAFRANLDSLSAGMRAPDTATPEASLLLLGASLLAAGGVLLRRPSV